MYDNRGLRTEETVLAVKAGTGSAASLTIEGQAGLAYDTGGRLKSYIAPFGVENGEAPQAALNYHLDDAGNVVEHTVATTAQPAVARRARQAKVGQTMVPRPGQIVEAVLTSKPENGVATVSLETATFDGTGFEVTRRVEPGAGGNPQVTTNIPGPGGFIAATLVDGPDADETAEVTVEYLYDPASERLLRRTERRPGQTDRVRMYFTLAGGARVEETDGAGATLRRWLPGATNLAEQVFELDPTSGDRAGNSRADWIWLLTDLDGNVATQLRGANDTPGDDDATILSTSPYSPYGTPGGGGTSTSSAITDTTPGSLLGFDGAHTDDVTGNLLLGPRQYDPGALRFTSADYFPTGAAQMGIGTDPLTGGNYLFAGANPVAFADNGHYPVSGGKTPDQDRAFWRSYWRARTDEHNAALASAAYAAQQTFPDAIVTTNPLPGLPGAGRNGGTGFPDLTVQVGDTIVVYEVKPDSAYGHRTGPDQLARYVNWYRGHGGDAFRGPEVAPLFPVPLPDGRVVHSRNGEGSELGLIFYTVRRDDEDPLEVEHLTDLDPFLVGAGITASSITYIRELSRTTAGAGVLGGLARIGSFFLPPRPGEVVCRDICDRREVA